MRHQHEILLPARETDGQLLHAPIHAAVGDSGLLGVGSGLRLRHGGVQLFVIHAEGGIVPRSLRGEKARVIRRGHPRHGGPKGQLLRPLLERIRVLLPGYSPRNDLCPAGLRTLHQNVNQGADLVRGHIDKREAQPLALRSHQNAIRACDRVSGLRKTSTGSRRIEAILRGIRRAARIAGGEGGEPLPLAAEEDLHRAVHVHGLHQPPPHPEIRHGAGIDGDAIGRHGVIGAETHASDVRGGLRRFVQLAPGRQVACLQQIRLAAQEKLERLGAVRGEQVFHGVGVTGITIETLVARPPIAHTLQGYAASPLHLAHGVAPRGGRNAEGVPLRVVTAEFRIEPGLRRVQFRGGCQHGLGR